MSELQTRNRFKNRKQDDVNPAAPSRIQKARQNKEGDYKSAYGGKPPKRHKPTDGGKPGTNLS